LIYGGVEVQLHAFLILTLDGGKWSISRPGRFNPEKGVPGTHSTRGYKGSKVGLNIQAKRKNYAPTGNRNPAVQPKA